MAVDYTVIVERDAEGWFVASVPELRGCHTQARTLDELHVRVLEAIELCLDDDATAVTKLEFVGVQRVAVPV